MAAESGLGSGYEGAFARGMAVAASGSVAGLMVVALVLSFASLVFAGPLDEYLPLYSVLLLAGTIVMNLVASWRSTMPGAIVIPQDTTTAILAGVAASVVTAVSVDARLGTTIAVVAAGSVLTAVVMLLLGHLRAGNLVRYIPLPVMGGFLAGTGWLLVAGASELTIAGRAWSAPSIVNLAGAFAIGLVLVLVLRGPAGIVRFAAIVAAAVALFYLGLAVTGTSPDEARALGLLPALPDGGRLPALGAVTVDWGAVLDAVPGLLVVPLVATMGMLLNVGGLELLADHDHDLDRELRMVGWANAAGAVTGSPAGYHALGASALAFRVGTRSRVIPLVAAAVCLAAIVAGPGLVGLLPVFVTAGVLVMLGIGFLANWLLERRESMPASEYLLMLTIVVAVAVVGFLPGVVYGMGAAVVLFTIRYSRLDPIRDRVTGADRSSGREWSAAERRILDLRAETVRIVELQGFLFFGTAHTAVAAITPDLTDARCVVVDFRRVEGCDSSAVMAFEKLAREAAKSGAELWLADVTPELATGLARSGVRFAGDLPEALEACERVLLAEGSEPEESAPFLPEGLWTRLSDRFERIELAPDEVLAEQGESSRSLYVVERGEVAAEVPVGNGRTRRLRSVGPGGVIGEFSIYAGNGRSARLRARGETVVHRLSAEAVADLERTDPEAAIAFHRAVAALLIERLSSSNEVVRSLVR